VDNAKIYHANALALACTQLNIKLLHRPPRDPPAGGLIERLFETLQGQLEAEVRASDILTLDELNRVLAAWLQTAYHLEVHSETKQSPQQRYHEASRFHRHVDLGTVLTFFHQRKKLKVNDEFVDVRLDNRFFAVDLRLRGDWLIVEYDPFSPLEEVQLYAMDGAYLGVAKRYDREPDSHPQPKPAVPEGPIQPHYLDALRADYEAFQQQQRRGGIDFYSARRRNVWSLTGFAGTFARLLGRKGGVSGLSVREMEAIATFHARHQRLTETLLRNAFAQAESPTIPQVLFQLQSLLDERNF
jgi:putative transposase